jgi:predicted aldo/keto reductase-like oxidoreductase
MVVGGRRRHVYGGCLGISETRQNKHIGFSTHADAARIMRIINTEKFSYVNLHAHFVGSYHAEGTMNGKGEQGNLAAVKRALELDMGVFQISPLDKGGKMYCPSKTLARTIGPKMTPAEFSMLTSWKSFGCHTVSVGFGRPMDVEEAISAAKMFTESKYDSELMAAEQRMHSRMEQVLGKEWSAKGTLNIPHCEVESTHGTSIGHMLWLYNLMKAFGMYDFCYDRYQSLKSQPWNEKKSFEENRKKM